MPFTDRQRAALERHYSYTRTGCVRLREIAPGMDDADRHDIALAALIRAARVHDDININFYFRCLKLEYIDWLRSPRNEGGTKRGGARRPDFVTLSRHGYIIDGPAEWNLVGTEDPATVDDRDEVEWLMAKLPDRARRVIRLRYYDGLRDREIARELGVSKSTAFKEHGDALGRLRSISTHYQEA